MCVKKENLQPYILTNRILYIVNGSDLKYSYIGTDNDL